MKKTNKWLDNFLIYLLVAYVVSFLGQVLGIILLNVPLGFCAGIIAAVTNQPLEAVIAGIPDVIQTSLLYAAFIGIWIVTILWLLKKNNRPILATISTKLKGNHLWMILFGLAIGGGLNSLCILAAYLHGDIKVFFDSFQPVGLVFIFVCVWIQSSAEELVCRGYLMQKLLHRYKNPWIGIIGNAVLFSALHLANDGVGPLALLNIVLAGILFSLMVYYMDSMWAAFAAHTAWNFTQNIIFGLPNSGTVVPFSIMKLEASTARDSFAYNVAFGVEGTWIAVLVQAVACAAIIFWGRKAGKKPTNIWPEEIVESSVEKERE